MNTKEENALKECRKAFEEWFEADAMPLESDWFRKDADGDYAQTHVDQSWSAWQAAWNARATPTGLQESHDKLVEALEAITAGSLSSESDYCVEQNQEMRRIARAALAAAQQCKGR
jgi:hypothetical protein